ncbi:hypothetical protein PybrP1_005684 [[Pythium] brassicae (nom. inval.)]|nr:hypothetical protein PybrP1_005684 [[Pythium] brassicae (nom. inval.)]
MASFQQTLRRFLRTNAALAAAPVAALTALSPSARLETAPEAPVASASAPAPVEFVGVFLAKESAQQLKERFPAKFAVAADDTLYLVLKYNPSEQEKEAFEPILGADAQIRVKGEAPSRVAPRLTDCLERAQVLVAVTTADGDPIEYDSGAEHAHITLSAAEGAGGLNAGYSNVLLERLRASDKLRFLLDEPSPAAGPESAGTSEWFGALPAFESKYFPLYNPFPATEAKLARTTESADAPLELKGTVCVSSAYDAETGACAAGSQKPECGFCKFMKAGPCGREFSAWEACLDRSKKEGSDFIDKCSAPTLALRDCVDANPEYYSVLNDPPAADDEQ